MSTLETFRQAAEARKRKKEENKDSNPLEANNMNMGQAFDRARKDNPNSPIVLEIKKANQAQAAEQFKDTEKRRFVQLRERFKEAGLMWFNTQAESTGMSYRHNRILIEQEKELWMQDLTILKNRPFEQRIELLSAMASGMQLTDERIPTAYRDSLQQDMQDMLSNPLSYLSPMLSGISFAPPSTLFMKAFCDMSDHSGKQKQEFKEFMVTKSGLKGTVELPQLFPAISQWLDQAK